MKHAVRQKRSNGYTSVRIPGDGLHTGDCADLAIQLLRLGWAFPVSLLRASGVHFACALMFGRFLCRSLEFDFLLSVSRTHIDPTLQHGVRLPRALKPLAPLVTKEPFIRRS